MQNDSLILQNQPGPPAQVGQALLFSDGVESAIVKEEAQGRYTLERFRVLRKEAFADCVALLAAAKPGYEGLRRIAGIVECHWLTVAAVRDDIDAAKTIDTLRERLSKKMLTAVELQVDRLLECPGSVPAGMIGMVIDQLSKNAELYGGRATGRVEHTQRVDIFAHWDEFMEQLPAGEPRQLDSTDVREIGLSGEKMPAITAQAEPAGTEPGRELEARGDAQSPVSATDAQAAPATDTASDTEASRWPADPEAAAHTPDARNGGGRGSPAVSGGARSRSGYSERNFSGNSPLSPPPI